MCWHLEYTFVAAYYSMNKTLFGQYSYNARGRRVPLQGSTNFSLFSHVSRYSAGKGINNLSSHFSLTPYSLFPHLQDIQHRVLTDLSVMENNNERQHPKRNVPHFQSTFNSSSSEKLAAQSGEQHQRKYSPPAFHRIPREDRQIPQSDAPDMNAGDQHARVRRYRRRSPSLSSQSDSSYNARRHSKSQNRGRGGRSQTGSRAVNQNLPQQQQVAPPKSGLEAIITPLRLGILLGCFDIIGGSLSVWMTKKRFAKGAQQGVATSGGQQQHTATGEKRSRVSSNRPRHSTTTLRREDRRRYHPYDSESTSETDSDYDERLRRTAEHVREQRRLDYERDRGFARMPQQARDSQGWHSRRR
ncbi:hypothetical protein M409DRAFT_57553 [Zasmidium cellare ATCC 36951]|uniref:Uncharacterized protein n=1 Tax=Zasmidium cellare ATCC 36951 TaxID=1080233 RepID=A0A6A6CAJ6_ZASCE|nr:uncharacterized protein M409DRAFT_57553 [Zasmidium cellare ATCC 36951]KAF2163258.1 hypothetical protein M409DRAFT_57553 [Zasmidium cellare ATCC 36951]